MRTKFFTHCRICVPITKRMNLFGSFVTRSMFGSLITRTLSETFKKRYFDFVQNKQFEEYYIGYSNSYNRINNQTIGMYVPQWANMHVYTDEPNPLIQQQLAEMNRKTKFEYLTNDVQVSQQYEYYLTMSSDHPNLLGLFFTFKQVNQSQKIYQASLTIQLSNVGYKDVELLFVSQPSPVIVARQKGTKGRFSRQDPRFDNRTLLNKDYWLIINLKEHSLTLGLGSRLTLKNTLLNYKLKQSTDDLVPMGVIPIRFEISKILLTQLLNINLTDYSTKKLPWQPTGPQFNPLNFSGYAFLESMHEMSDVQYQYIEEYGAGEYCQDFQKTRHIVVRMVCSHRSLLEIIKVNEPKVCNYKMEVGTYLLCDERDQMSYQDHAPSQVGQRIVCNMQ